MEKTNEIDENNIMARISESLKKPFNQRIKEDSKLEEADKNLNSSKKGFYNYGYMSRDSLIY